MVFDALGSSGAMSVHARWNSAISVARLVIWSIDKMRGSDSRRGTSSEKTAPMCWSYQVNVRPSLLQISASMPVKRVEPRYREHRSSCSWSSTKRKYEPYDDTLLTAVDPSSRWIR